MPETTGDLDQNLIEQLRFWVNETFPRDQLWNEIAGAKTRSEQAFARVAALESFLNSHERSLVEVKNEVRDCQELVRSLNGVINGVEISIEANKELGSASVYSLKQDIRDLGVRLEQLASEFNGTKSTVADLVAWRNRLNQMVDDATEMAEKSPRSTFRSRLRWLLHGSK